MGQAETLMFYSVPEKQQLSFFQMIKKLCVLFTVMSSGNFTDVLTTSRKFQLLFPLSQLFPKGATNLVEQKVTPCESFIKNFWQTS